MNYVPAAMAAASFLTAAAARIERPAVSLTSVPNGGIQPQVVERHGVVHLIYFAGQPEKGYIYYLRSGDFGRTFSAPVRVNHTLARDLPSATFAARK